MTPRDLIASTLFTSPALGQLIGARADEIRAWACEKRPMPDWRREQIQAVADGVAAIKGRAAYFTDKGIKDGDVVNYGVSFYKIEGVME